MGCFGPSHVMVQLPHLGSPLVYHPSRNRGNFTQIFDEVPHDLHPVDFWCFLMIFASKKRNQHESTIIQCPAVAFLCLLCKICHSNRQDFEAPNNIKQRQEDIPHGSGWISNPRNNTNTIPRRSQNFMHWMDWMDWMGWMDWMDWMDTKTNLLIHHILYIPHFTILKYDIVPHLTNKSPISTSWSSTTG